MHSGLSDIQDVVVVDQKVISVKEAAELLGTPVELLLEHLPPGSTEHSRLSAEEIHRHVEAARRMNERSAAALQQLLGQVDDQD